MGSVHMMLKILAAVLLATVAARHPVWDLPPRELPVGTTYGGDYAWNNEGYEMATEGWSPLALAEEGTIKALNWTYIAMTSDGSFIRPGTANKIFPDAGTTLNWRYNGTDSNGNDKVVIDFCSECPCESPWSWRWDEGVANSDHSVWTFTGHVYSSTFPWTLTKMS